MTTVTPVSPSVKPAARAPRADAPLPPSLPIPKLAQSAGWIFRPIELLRACQRRFGDIFTLTFAGVPPIIAISEPAVVKEIFTGDPAIFNAARGNFILKPILGEGSLLLLDGERHLRERRLMMPAFHGERMQTYGRVMREATDRAIDRFPIGTPFPIHHQMQAITLEVILRTVFGVEDESSMVEPREGGGERGAAGAREELRQALIEMLSYGEQPGLLLMIGRDGDLRFPQLHEALGGLSPWKRFQRVIERVDALLAKEIERRRTQPLGEDVLSMLLAARDEHEKGLTTGELVDEMKTMLVAGHETSATALTWTLLELLENRSILTTLRAKIAAGDEEYLDAVIRETLRLHPIVPMVARFLEAPVTLGGRDYPAGAVLAPNIFLTQRSPTLFPDPERFDPERFLRGKMSPYEFFPFGGGVRRCIGLAFALFEMKIVLRQIVTRAELELAPGYRPKLVRRGITFAVSQGLPVIAQRL